MIHALVKTWTSIVGVLSQPERLRHGTECLRGNRCSNASGKRPSALMAAYSAQLIRIAGRSVNYRENWGSLYGLCGIVPVVRQACLAGTTKLERICGLIGFGSVDLDRSRHDTSHALPSASDPPLGTWISGRRSPGARCVYSHFRRSFPALPRSGRLHRLSMAHEYDDAEWVESARLLENTICCPSSLRSVPEDPC